MLHGWLFKSLARYGCTLCSFLTLKKAAAKRRNVLAATNGL